MFGQPPFAAAMVASYSKNGADMCMSIDSLHGPISPFDGRHRMYDDAAALGAINMHIHALVPFVPVRRQYKYEQKI